MMASLTQSISGTEPLRDHEAVRRPLFVSPERVPQILALGTALAVVLLSTWVSYALHLRSATRAFIDLIAVVLVARKAGFVAASAVSIAAVGCQACFADPLVLSRSLGDFQNWIALFACEYCALVVSRLSGSVVRQTTFAERRRMDMESLYEIGRLVLQMDRTREAGPQLTRFIERTMNCDEAILFDPATPGASDLNSAIERRVRDTYLAGRDEYDEASQTWFRVLWKGERPIGSLAVRGGEVGGTVANALASLAAVALESARSFEKQSRTEAARQSEQLRTAVLDALAHEVKTPLTAIRAASSGLLETRSLTPDHAELVELIDDEAARLHNITDRLLSMARLDARDVRLTRQRLPVNSVLRRAAASLEFRAPDRLIRIAETAMDVFICGDEQLVQMALAQLVDNALKYSMLGSVISMAAEISASDVVISVHNVGHPIPLAEIERIFDRFYRAGGSARNVSGTGLGLSVTRKIAAAHGGRVWAVSDERQGTTFCLAIPVWSGTNK